MTSELTEKQQSLRLEFSAAIISFRERLVSIAQYNLEEIDEVLRQEIFSIINNEEIAIAEKRFLYWGPRG